MSLTDRTCSTCGTPIGYSGRGRPREYCNEHTPDSTRGQRANAEQHRQYQRDYYAMHKAEYDRRKTEWRSRPAVKAHLTRKEEEE